MRSAANRQQLTTPKWYIFPKFTISLYTNTNRAIISLLVFSNHFKEICTGIKKSGKMDWLIKKCGFTNAMAKPFDIINKWMVILLYRMTKYFQGG